MVFNDDNKNSQDWVAVDLLSISVEPVVLRGAASERSLEGPTKFQKLGPR